MAIPHACSPADYPPVENVSQSLFCLHFASETLIVLNFLAFMIPLIVSTLVQYAFCYVHFARSYHLFH